MSDLVGEGDFRHFSRNLGAVVLDCNDTRVQTLVATAEKLEGFTNPARCAWRNDKNVDY